MREKRISPLILILSILLTFFTTVSVFMLVVPNAMRGYFTKTDPMSKYYEIKSIVDRYYVEDVTDEELAEGIALGAMYSLKDSYSAYYDNEQYDTVLDSSEGLEFGIGVNIVSHPDTENIFVISVSTGSPADIAGIKAGDSIIAVEGVSVSERGYSESVMAISGEEGSVCKIDLLRGDKKLTVEAKRGQFVSTSVFSHMIGSVAYIEIIDFNTATVTQFKDAVLAAQENGATGLIFDVRKNGGGTLSSVEEMLDLLLPEGDVVSATYKNGKKEVLFTSDKNEIDLPMAVLCDGGTASAAELFAAAIRDFGKGKLIGETTYGKGVMQRTFGLSDGSAVRLTIAYFNPPSGINFNGKGLAPDIEVTLTEDQRLHFYMLTDQTDPVIAEAVRYLEEG